MERNPIGNNSVLCDPLCNVQDATHCIHIIRNKKNNFIFAWKVIQKVIIVYHVIFYVMLKMRHIVHVLYEIKQIISYLPGR